jgi:regulatory protein
VIRWRPPATLGRPRSRDLADAYLDGLRLLARRELSEVQLRARLARRDHPDDDVNEAVARLRAEGALDDTRTAVAIARTAVRLGRFGPRRVRRAVEAAGVPPEVADRALQEAFEGVDAAAVVDAALERGLQGHGGPLNDRTAARLYRRLLSHGHDPELVSRALAARRRTRQG